MTASKTCCHSAAIVPNLCRFAAKCKPTCSLRLYAAESVQQHEIALPESTSQPLKRRQDGRELDAKLDLKQEPEAGLVSRQGQAGQPAREQVQRVQEEQHAAHAAAFSLEAVMEAQSALVHERHRNPQPNMTEDEKKAHRRRQDANLPSRFCVEPQFSTSCGLTAG